MSGQRQAPFQPGEIPLDAIVKYGPKRYQIGFVRQVDVSKDRIVLERPRSFLTVTHADIVEILSVQYPLAYPRKRVTR